MGIRGERTPFKALGVKKNPLLFFPKKAALRSETLGLLA
jgi:hypothetical protein